MFYELKYQIKDKLLLLILLCLCSNQAGGAKLPDWAKPLALVDCSSYDAKEVEAVFLLDHAEYIIKPNGETVRRFQQAYRVLTAKGISYGTQTIHFDKNSRAKLVRAAVLYPNGEVKAIKDRDALISQDFDDMLFSDKKKKIITLPDVCKGAFVCFEYEIRKKIIYPFFSWYFQSSIPVVRSELVIQVPTGAELSWKTYNINEFHPVISGNCYHFQRENVPYIPDEPLSPPVSDLAERVEIRYLECGKNGKQGNAFDTWANVAKWYGQLTRDKRLVTPFLKKLSDDACLGAGDASEKIRRLCRWVQSKVRYVAIDIDIGGIIPHFPEKVAKVKYGDCKDKSFLLLTLLRAQEIPAWPVLCIAKKYGLVDQEYPQPNAFNHCITAFEGPDRNIYFFDPTSETVGYPYLPAGLAGTYGLLVREDGGELKKLAGIGISEIRINVTATMIPNGTMNARVLETYTPPALSSFRNRLQGLNDKERYNWLKRNLLKKMPDVELKTLNIRNLFQPEEDMIIEYSLTSGHFAKSLGGGLWMLHPFFIQDLRKPVLGKTERRLPVDLRSQAILTRQEVILEYPQFFQIEEGIVPETLKTDFGEFSVSCEESPGKLVVIKTYSILDKTLPKERYNDVRKFFEFIRNIENTEILFAN